MSGNLGITQVVAAQNQKEVTINAAMLRLDAAISETFDANLASGNVTVTAEQGRACAMVRATGVATSGRTVTLPQLERVFLITNPASSSHSVGFLRGATTVTLAVGETATVRTDGTTDGLVVLIRSAGSGGSLAVQDEGSAVAGAPHSTMNFVGAGVTATNAGGGVATITIPGGSGLTIEDEGATVTGGPHTALNFVGAGVSVANAGGGEATVTISGGGGGNAEGRAHVVPTLSAFTWVNQGSAAANDRAYGIVMKEAARNTVNLRLLVKAAPSTPYEIIARHRLSGRNASNGLCGLCWRESASGKITTVTTLGGRAMPSLRQTVHNWTNPTTFSSAPFDETDRSNALAEWIRIRDDGATRYFDVSVGGDDWHTLYSVARTTHLTPDQVGFFLEPNNATAPAGEHQLLILSWEQI